MGMRYKVYWKSQSQKDAVIFECGNEEQAKAMFLQDNEEREEPLIIEYDDKVIDKEYIEPVKTEQSSPSHSDGHKGKSASTSNESKQQVSGSIEDKLDRLYDVMNHIRWIGLGIGGMFAITFILPQCTGG
jgi:hypothetical protein